MGTPPTSEAVAQAAVNLLAECGGNQSEAARRLGLNREAFRSRVARGAALGLRPGGAADQTDEQLMRAQMRRLEQELASAQKTALSHIAIKREIVGLKTQIDDTPTPRWMLSTTKPDSAPGVPTLFVSDLHWGEVVDPKQINGVNTYDLATAHRRLDTLAERAVRLLGILSPKMDYPGLVLVLGGDMISGNIHDELTATNEVNSMPAVVDLYGKLASMIAGFADTFGRVFVPCVTGNHGRDTTKIWGKDRHHTSFDWLLYTFLAKRFEDDKRVTFLVPDGSDAYWRVYEHRYLLTHGDQFRGGDGMIGALGPIIRGDHKKRSRNAQIEMGYDTMLLGHFHQYIHLARLIVNGSLKGYDEYAYSNNFGFEEPQQALWATHPKYGITYRMPVFVDKQTKRGAAPKTSWVSVAA